MASTVPVSVLDLGGNTLELEMAVSDSEKCLRDVICKEWGLDNRAFRMLVQSSVVGTDADIGSIVPSDGSPLVVQLVKFDPLLELGEFEQSGHRGIEIQSRGDDKSAKLLKTSNTPDSNNVFLRHPIREPCFAEFHVEVGQDEMSIGVTYDREALEQISGFMNLRCSNTWVYSKSKKYGRASMPALLFGGAQVQPEGVSAFQAGDTVAVFVDPEKRLVRFYRNGVFVASNLPDWPLPPDGECPLWMYAMVDYQGDEISVVRFGPGEPY